MTLSSTVTCRAVSRETPTKGGDYVILLHGLGRTALSMKRMEWALTKQGYQVVNVSYPSTRLSVQEATDVFLTPLLREQAPNPNVKIHFVTHSLGGIILRQYLHDHPIRNLGRVVMLAPPNQGSEIADTLRHNRVYKFFTGLSGQQLGTGASSLPRQLGPARFEVGIIAGDCSFSPFSGLVRGPDDGKVSVQNAKLQGMSDFLVLHHTHTWIMWRKDTLCAVAQFLKSGAFRG